MTIAIKRCVVHDIDKLVETGKIQEERRENYYRKNYSIMLHSQKENFVYQTMGNRSMFPLNINVKLKS